MLNSPPWGGLLSEPFLLAKPENNPVEAEPNMLLELAKRLTAGVLVVKFPNKLVDVLGRVIPVLLNSEELCSLVMTWCERLENTDWGLGSALVSLGLEILRMFKKK